MMVDVKGYEKYYAKMQQFESFDFLAEGYPMLASYVSPIRPAKYAVVGRKSEMASIMATFGREIVTNAILLGEPGSGKTEIVKGLSVLDAKRIYLEVDLSAMASGQNGALELANRLKQLFDEVERFRRTNLGDLEIVLFIDEFHRIIKMSSSATEELKPALAESGVRGIRVLGATTFGEFNDFVAPNKALNDRLEPIRIRELSKEVVVEILKNIAKQSLSLDVYQKIPSKLYGQIYEYTNRYIPSSPQPRKSIFLLDRMLGWHLSFNKPMDMELLAYVLYIGVGVNIKFSIDAKRVKAMLDERVFSQQFATSVLERRLQITTANINDPTRPLSSFLFTGPTGVGKTELSKAMSTVLFGDDRALIRFDMSEYVSIDTIDIFKERLTLEVWAKPYGIILLDEIEKANPAITRLLLQVLDDGRLSDKYGREVSFKNTYIILTTNAGSEIYESIAHYAKSDSGEDGMMEYNKVIRRSLINNDSFPTELLNRIDVVVPFQPLSLNTLKKIVQSKLDKLTKRIFAMYQTEVLVESDVVDFLVGDKYDEDTNSGGARGLEHEMDLHVTTKIAEMLNTSPEIKRWRVYVDGKMQHQNKFMVTTQATVKIEPMAKRSLSFRKAG